MSIYYIIVDLFLDGVIHVINVINQQPSPEGPLPVGSYGWFFKALLPPKSLAE